MPVLIYRTHGAYRLILGGKDSKIGPRIFVDPLKPSGYYMYHQVWVAGIAQSVQ